MHSLVRSQDSRSPRRGWTTDDGNQAKNQPAFVYIRTEIQTTGRLGPSGPIVMGVSSARLSDITLQSGLEFNSVPAAAATTLPTPTLDL